MTRSMHFAIPLAVVLFLPGCAREPQQNAANAKNKEAINTTNAQIQNDPITR